MKAPGQAAVQVLGSATVNRAPNQSASRLCLLVTVAACCLGVARGGQAPDADLAKGRIVVTRARTAGPRILGGKAVGVIDAPVETVWAALGDYNNYPRFMPSLPVAFIVDGRVVAEVKKRQRWSRRQLEALLDKHKLDKPNSDTIYFYQVLNVPSPVRDRWYLLEMKRGPKQHTARWTLVVGNLRDTNGSWELKPFAGGDKRTLATYTTYSDLGFPLPRFILRIGSTQTLPGVIEGLRKRVRELQAEDEGQK